MHFVKFEDSFSGPSILMKMVNEDRTSMLPTVESIITTKNNIFTVQESYQKTDKFREWIW